MGTVHWIEIQIQCSMQIHCFKKCSIWYELYLQGSSGSSVARVMRERAYSREFPLRKKMKVEQRSQLIPGKHTENLMLSTA